MEQYLQSFENNRMVMYTAIIGNYDTLKNPEYIDENCDYVCFTDNRGLTSDIWQIRLIENTELDNTRCQRMYKVLPHKFLPEYDYSVYIDGNVRVIGSFRDFVRKQWKGAALLGLKHPSRDNVYDEAEACINLKKDDPELIRKQIDRYKGEGYPADNVLTVNNIIFRKHKDASLIKVMEDWWEEIINNSRRDQLSLGYVCWKNHFVYDVSELKCYRSDYWLNPGIHTDNIRDVEKELIDHIQLTDYHEYLLNEKDKCIALKEQEKKDAVALKTQEYENVISLKEQEFDNMLALKAQEKETAVVLIKQECERMLALKEQEFESALALKEQEKEEMLALKQQELGQIITIKEQELEQLNNELYIKTQEVSDLKARLEHMEHTLSWRYTAIFRKIFIKRK